MDKNMYQYSVGGVVSYNSKKPPVSVELTKLVRQQWEHDHKPVRYVMESVKRRTGEQLVVEEPRKNWRNNFYRRQQNMQIGFFNPVHRPYQCLGGSFSLDPKDLVLNIYKNSLPKQLKERTVYVRRKRPEEEIRVTPEEEPNLSTCTSPVKANYTDEQSGDHMTLWEHIRESNDQILYVSSGQPYQLANKNIQKARKKTSKCDVHTPSNLMSMKSVSSLAEINFGKTCAVVISSPVKMDSSMRANSATCEAEPPAAPEEASKEEVSSDHQLRTNTSRLIELYEREKRERIKRDILLKLEAIYITLLSISNMKTSLLRNRNPLSKELFAALKKEQPQCERSGISRLTSGRYSMNQRTSVSTDTLASQENANIFSSTGNTPQSNASPGKNGASVTPGVRRMTTFGNSPRGIGVFGAANVWAMKARAKVAAPQAESVETWDDLLQTSDRNQKLFSKLQITGMFLGALNKRKRINELEERKMPLWQTVANEKSHISPQKRRSSDPESRLRQIKDDYQSLKASLSRENQAELNKLERERIALFEFKFNVLENTPLLFEQHFKEMKRALKNFSFNTDSMEIQPSEWFQKLKEETVTQGCDTDEAVQAIIHKMARFSQMDSKTVPQSKAKLCMLMMSMPAYEICKVTIQQAYKFVFEEILLGSSSTLERWLKSRRLPMVLLESTK